MEVDHPTQQDIAGKPAGERKRMNVNSDCSLAFLAFSFLALLPFYVPPALSDETACTVTNDSDSNSLMTCQGEHKLERGTLLATLPKLGKVWSLNLEFKPLEHTHGTKVANIIHLSEATNARVGAERAGIISIWTHQYHDLYFSSAESVNKIQSTNFNTNYNGTQVGQWTKISISQEQVEKGNCVKYRQFIRIDGQEIFRRINKAPQDFQQVDVYASNWRNPQPGVIKNFVILVTGYVSHCTQHGLDI